MPAPATNCAVYLQSSAFCTPSWGSTLEKSKSPLQYRWPVVLGGLGQAAGLLRVGVEEPSTALQNRTAPSSWSVSSSPHCDDSWAKFWPGEEPARGGWLESVLLSGTHHAGVQPGWDLGDGGRAGNSRRILCLNVEHVQENNFSSP